LFIVSGVLQSAYTPWLDIVNSYGDYNASSRIQTVILNDTQLFTLDQIETGEWGITVNAGNSLPYITIFVMLYQYG